MKILFTLTTPLSPNTSGVPRTTLKLGKFFFENGYDVFYFSMSSIENIQIDNGKLFIAPEQGNSNNRVNLIELEKAIEKIKPDIIINQMPYDKHLSKTLYHLKLKSGFRLLGCLRNSLFSFKDYPRSYMRETMNPHMFKLFNNAVGVFVIKSRHWFVHRKKLKKILDYHDRFILLTPPNRWELKYFIGNYKNEKVVWIPNSIPYIFDNIAIKEKRILHVGGLNTHQKRSDLLIEFWEKIYDLLPDWNFDIVGNGSYYKKLEEEIARRKLPRIILYGKQIPEPFFEKASIFVIPSAFEGFPNTLLEAQSHGCVTLAFESYPAISWIVNQNVDTFLSQPFNVIDMSANALNLANNEQLMNRMRIAALNNARRFTINNVGKMWLELFNNLNA